MKKILSAILISAVLTGSVFAKGFNEATGEARSSEIQEPSHNKKPTNKSSSSSSDGSCGDACIDSCAETMAVLLVAGWAVFNVGVSYTDFPYQRFTPNYVVNGPLSKVEGDTAPSCTGKKIRFSADASILHYKDLGWGAELNFEGLFFPVIGPYLSLTNFRDETVKQDPEFFGNFRLGGQLSLIQHDLLCASFLMQWSHWYGDTKWVHNGCVIGVDLRSYPIYPLTVQWRGTYGSYNDDIFIATSDLQAGIIYKRIEGFAGWKYMSTGNHKTNRDKSHWNGYYGGVRVYF